jgi:hypothetical protein
LIQSQNLIQITELGNWAGRKTPPPPCPQNFAGINGGTCKGDLNKINSALARGKTQWEISFHELYISFFLLETCAPTRSKV